MLSSPKLRSLIGFSSLAECLPWGTGPQGALHVGIHNCQAKDITGIDPSKT